MTTTENDFLAPARVNQLNRKHSDISNNSSEPDSLLELYKSQARNRSVPSGLENGGKRKVANMSTNPEEDDSNWIHRDKLAQIESREMEEAGLRVAPISRSTSRSASNSLDRQDQGVERYPGSPQVDGAPYAKRDEKRQRVVSPIPAEDEEGIIDFELRTPEEVAAEREERMAFTARAPPRLAGSRLPVMKRSPVTVSGPFTERDSPLGSTIQNTMPEGRPRSRSVGSQNVLDSGGEAARPQTPVRASTGSDKQSQGSPVGKPPTKNAPASRKPSTTRNVSSSKTRTASQAKISDSPPKRPSTSSGMPRPSTSHRPEGEAPWIASMYKPDPRLPPDQQMLPTHAKRLAQEQWEKEGKIGSIYDTQFRLLNATELSPPEPRSPTKESMTSSVNEDERSEQENPAHLTVDLNNKWPLSASPPLDSPPSQLSGASGMPEISGTEHGGYSTMPKIHSPSLQTQVQQPTTSPRPKVTQKLKIPDPPQDEEVKDKKGACGCCVVM
jgi:hypothetical protein